MVRQALFFCLPAGLANPGPIVSSFYMDQDLPGRVRLDGIVTVVDAKHVSRHLDEAEADPDKVSEAVEQVCSCKWQLASYRYRQH